MKPTHEQILLHALRDGKPHSHHQLYALGMIVHSRAASLRKKGVPIRSWRSEGSYWYQLDALDGGDGSRGSRAGVRLSSPSSALAEGGATSYVELDPGASPRPPVAPPSASASASLTESSPVDALPIPGQLRMVA